MWSPRFNQCWPKYSNFYFWQWKYDEKPDLNDLNDFIDMVLRPGSDLGCCDRFEISKVGKRVFITPINPDLDRLSYTYNTIVSPWSITEGQVIVCEVYGYGDRRAYTVYILMEEDFEAEYFTYRWGWRKAIDEDC